jgi:flagellar protein FliO/FliZ
MPLLFFQADVQAEQVKSAKDWIENPEKYDKEQESPKETTEKSDSNTNDSSNVGLTIWDFVKMIFATIFVVALLYFLLKFINKKSNGYKNNQLVQNIGGTSLGANRSVQIIKVGNRLFVLGVGESIQLIREIDNEEEASQIISEYNNRMDQLIQPSDIVTKVMNRVKGMKTKKGDTNEDSFSSILSKQLEDISKGRKKLYDEIEKKGPDKK